MGNKNPPWQRSNSYRTRKVETRNLRQRILIVCEGKETEANYFSRFRVNTKIYKVDIHGVGCNTASLVREAVSLKEQNHYDQVWCVFDRDSFPAQDFNTAFEIARHNDIEIAYSK
ncbi:MAG: RloB family protein [Acidobacteriota bacterium]